MSQVLSQKVAAVIGHMTQAEANDYWADKPYKKFVVTLDGGTPWKPESETLYVGASSTDGAIRCAEANAMRVTRPSRVTCRLATAQDLGCTRCRA